jgi:protein ImuA
VPPLVAALADLRERVRGLERGEAARRSGVVGAALSFGVAAIDHHLPDGGLAYGAVHAVDGREQAGDGAASGFVAGLLARAMAERPGDVLWVSARPDLDGVGLAELGVDPGRLILARPTGRAGLAWAVEEGLRTPGLAAVIGELDDLEPVAGRRLQLAAEAGGALGLVLRRSAPIDGPPLASVFSAWRVEARPTQVAMEIGGGLGRARWCLDLLRCRNGRPANWIVEWDDEADCFALAATPADRSAAPGTAWRRAG